MRNHQIQVLFLFSLILTLGSCVSEMTGIVEGIKITEFMAKNDSVLMSGEDYPDWLEISNTSSDTIDLTGWKLSDNKKKLGKSLIQNCILLPNQSKVFFASGIDSLSDHLGFKLRSSSGGIYLSSPEERIVDKVKYSQQIPDYSSVLYKGKWVLTADSSPGELKEPVNYYKGIAPDIQIEFIQNAGRTLVDLSSSVEGDIYYSINGQYVGPDNQTLYTQAFALDSAKVIHAELRTPDYYSFSQSARAYVNKEKHDLPVFSLVTEPDNLWDAETGIYVEGNHTNYHKRTAQWIKPGVVEYQIDSVHEFIPVDFKIYGMGTRKRPKKSIACIGRRALDNDFFSSHSKKNVDGFVLRACYSDNSRYKNELVKGVNDIMNGRTLMQEYQPVVLYLNGEYWGVFNLYERKNKAFIKAHYGVQPVHVLNGSYSTTKIVKGSAESYLNFESTLNSKDLEDPETFEFLNDHFDLESYTDFWIHELYTNKADRFNNRFWKVDSDTARWRYMSYDFDVGFADPDNKRTLQYFNDDRNLGIHNFGNFIKNPRYKMMFFERLCDFLNFGYRADVAENILNGVDSLTALEFKRDFERWEPEWDKSKDDGDHQKKHIVSYVEERKNFLMDSIAHQFGLTERVTIVKDFEEGGKLLVNGYEVIDQVEYFIRMPIQLSVELEPGYEFVGWEGTDMDIPQRGEVNFDKSVQIQSKIQKK